jgi:hypothetical protein
MNSFVLLPLQESMAQRGACSHDQWRGYMSIPVFDHGIIKSKSMLTAVICQVIKFDVDILWDCFCQELKLMPAIHYQLWTLSALHLDREHHLPHTLLPEKDTYCLPEGNQ